MTRYATRLLGWMLEAFFSRSRVGGRTRRKWWRWKSLVETFPEKDCRAFGPSPFTLNSPWESVREGALSYHIEYSIWYISSCIQYTVSYHRAYGIHDIISLITVYGMLCVAFVRLRMPCPSERMGHTKPRRSTNTLAQDTDGKTPNNGDVADVDAVHRGIPMATKAPRTTNSWHTSREYDHYFPCMLCAWTLTSLSTKKLGSNTLTRDVIQQKLHSTETCYRGRGLDTEI